jgi:hypothetical protein
MEGELAATTSGGMGVYLPICFSLSFVKTSFHEVGPVV